MEYEITYVTGSIRFGQPTGRWRLDVDGWWREVMTDTLWLDDAGNVTRREPCEALVGLSEPYNRFGEPINVPPARTGWLWRLLGMERPAVTEVSE